MKHTQVMVVGYVLILCLLLSVGKAAEGTCSEDRSTPEPLPSCDYDFIVAGGGTAGNIVAARLANAGYHVLVLESGSKVYDNATKSLELLFPILFGVPLTTIEDLVSTLTGLLNEIPIGADINWLADTLSSVLSGISKREVSGHKPKRDILKDLTAAVDSLVSNVGSAVSDVGTAVSGVLGGTSGSPSSSSSSTTSAATTGSNGSELLIGNLLQGLINGLIGSIAGLIPNLQECALFAPYLTMSETAHYYSTVPQIFSQKREMDYPRGNLIGGSSAVNQMVYFRGSQRDFDTWANEFGLVDWSFDNILKYFIVYENNEDISNTTIHGHDGPINITLTKLHYPNPTGDAFVNSAANLGWTVMPDASDPRAPYGASYWQSFVGANGKRSDSSAYIRLMDAKGKVCWNMPRDQCGSSQTLHVWTETFVTKILFNGTRAIGVEYSKGVPSQARSQSPYFSSSTNEGTKHHAPYNKWDKTTVQASPFAERLGCPVAKSLAFNYSRPGDQYVPLKPTQYTPLRVTACHEVILAAGSVGTAQLLMLSGIGPADHLRARSIPVLADLNVGRHIQDHQELFIVWLMPPTFDPGFNFPAEILGGFPQFSKYFSDQRSFFSSNGVVAGLDGSSEGPSGTVPTFHMHFVTIGPIENFDYNIGEYDVSFNAPYRLPRSIVELLLLGGTYVHLVDCELSGNHVNGTIELRNSDPFVPPFIDPRYGSSDEDNRELVGCLKIMREVMNNMDPYYRGEEQEPSASATTDEELLQVVINNVWGHHIASSAPMGTCNDTYAVTDHKGRVYKVDGLRVADISLFPTIPHGNPAGVVMMVAEKIAHDILQDYGNAQWPPIPL